MTRCDVKIRWFTRRQAKRARRHLPSEHLRPYWCPAHLAWHLGHLPRVVLLGQLAADQVYRRGRWAA